VQQSRVGGSVAEYLFAGGSGTTVTDQAGSLDLTITDPGNVTWGANGLTFNANTEAISTFAASDIYNSVTSSGELTFEAWVDPASLTQTGPARIVSVSAHGGSRNATLGQQNSGIDWRTRATNTGSNGVPSLGTGNGAITTTMTHVVATFDTNGDREIWIDGVLDSSNTGAGAIATWDASMKLVVGNEASGDRPWLGEICLAAVYDTALTPTEISQNYNAGCPTTGGPNTVNTRTITITDATHPLAAGFTGDVDILEFNDRNIEFITATQLTPANPSVVADVGATGQHVLIGYEPGDTLTDSSTAADYRVGFSGFNQPNANISSDGFDMLDAAINWVTPATTPTTSWSEDYDYDTAGRPTITTYGDSGTRTIGYDDAGRMNSDIIKDDLAAVTASTEYTYSCDHELIAKNITDLDGNTGEGLNVYTYDHAGRLTSWNDAATALPTTCPTTTGSGSGGGGGSSRVAGSVAEYLFAGGTGNTTTTVADQAGSLDLTITDPANVTWGTNGLTFNANTEAISTLAASDVINDVTSSDEISMEAWVDTASLTQTGPARLLTVSANGWSRNATLGQQNSGIDWRTRASNTGNNGVPSLSTGNGAITTNMTHIVATFDANGDREIWIDGVLDSSGTGAGLIGAWDNSMKLVVGNEIGGTRPWLGEICLAAIYDTALTPTEISQNYSAGCPTTGGTPPPPSGGDWTLAGELYTYDNAGNRLTAGTDTFTYDNRNRLLTDPDGSYDWNPVGTLATYTPNSGPVETYTFDAAGRLTDITDGANTTDYTYDSLDRIAERDGAAFTYNGSQWDPTSDGTDTFHRTPSGNLLAYEDPSGLSHAVDNNHYDLTALVAADGTVNDTATYDPWGDPVDDTGTTNPVLGYQSDYTDPDTEHVWMGTRWYQPSSGTFLSRDTYAGELSTPFSLNRYTYATNNPLNRWDPDGRQSVIVWTMCGLEAGKCTDIIHDTDDGSYTPVTTVATGLEAGWQGDPEPPPAPVPVGIPVTQQGFIDFFNNLQITDPVWQHDQDIWRLNILATIVNSASVGDSMECESSTNSVYLAMCDEAAELIELGFDLGLIEFDPTSASNGALRPTTCGIAGCHLWDPLGDLLVPGNTVDNLGFLVGISGLESAAGFATWGSLPKGSTAPHHLSGGQPTIRERFQVRADQARGYWDRVAGRLTTRGPRAGERGAVSVSGERWRVGNDIQAPTARGTSPSWSTVRSRFWKNEAAAPQHGSYTPRQLERMARGRAPQRYNPDKGGMESMDLSHEPVPARDGGTAVTPRWPQDHATVDPYRRPGY